MVDGKGTEGLLFILGKGVDACGARTQVALSLNHGSNQLWLGFDLGKNSSREGHSLVVLYPVRVNPRNPGRQEGSGEVPATGGLRSGEKGEKKRER
jgi:hypothetical protein